MHNVRKALDRKLLPLMLAWLSLCGSFGLAQTSANTQPSNLEALRSKAEAAPQDATARLELARALRLAGKHEQAALEYLEASALEPTMYLAYHELSLCQARNDQLDEAIDRLKHLSNERPKDLMLRVAMSELLEKRGDNYRAARTLVDLVYKNAVPDRYVAKVQARIHFLLSKCREVQTPDNETTETGEMDSAPVPLPDTGLRRPIASKGKDGRPPQGFGHTTLLP